MNDDQHEWASSHSRRGSSIMFMLLGSTLYQKHQRTAKTKCSSRWLWKAGVRKDDDSWGVSSFIIIIISSSSSSRSIISNNSRSSSSRSCRSKLACVGWMNLHENHQRNFMTNCRWGKAGAMQNDDNQRADGRTQYCRLQHEKILKDLTETRKCGLLGRLGLVKHHLLD